MDKKLLKQIEQSKRDRRINEVSYETRTRRGYVAKLEAEREANLARDPEKERLAQEASDRLQEKMRRALEHYARHPHTKIVFSDADRYIETLRSMYETPSQ